MRRVAAYQWLWLSAVSGHRALCCVLCEHTESCVGLCAGVLAQQLGERAAGVCAWAVTVRAVALAVLGAARLELAPSLEAQSY